MNNKELRLKLQDLLMGEYYGAGAVKEKLFLIYDDIIKDPVKEEKKEEEGDYWTDPNHPKYHFHHNKMNKIRFLKNYCKLSLKEAKDIVEMMTGEVELNVNYKDPYKD